LRKVVEWTEEEEEAEEEEDHTIVAVVAGSMQIRNKIIRPMDSKQHQTLVFLPSLAPRIQTSLLHSSLSLRAILSLQLL
jgi:hypothetical protein